MVFSTKAFLQYAPHLEEDEHQGKLENETTDPRDNTKVGIPAGSGGARRGGGEQGWAWRRTWHLAAHMCASCYPGPPSIALQVRSGACTQQPCPSSLGAQQRLEKRHAQDHCARRAGVEGLRWEGRRKGCRTCDLPRPAAGTPPLDAFVRVCRIPPKPNQKMAGQSFPWFQVGRAAPVLIQVVLSQLAVTSPSDWRRQPPKKAAQASSMMARISCAAQVEVGGEEGSERRGMRRDGVAGAI